jgi:hypothetical protein
METRHIYNDNNNNVNKNFLHRMFIENNIRIFELVKIQNVEALGYPNFAARQMLNRFLRDEKTSILNLMVSFFFFFV